LETPVDSSFSDNFYSKMNENHHEFPYILNTFFTLRKSEYSPWETHVFTCLESYSENMVIQE